MITFLKIISFYVLYVVAVSIAITVLVVLIRKPTKTESKGSQS